MSFLVDYEIEKRLDKKPPLVESTDSKMPIDRAVQIQPSSMDLRLSRFYRSFKDLDYIDVLRDVDYLVDEKESQSYEPIVIKPMELILSSSVEKINLPSNIFGWVTTRSSLARHGILTHIASFMNPGYSGIVPLQLINLSPRPVVIRPYLRICTILFEDLGKKCKLPYDKREDRKYLHELKPEPSKLGSDLEIKEIFEPIRKEVVKKMAATYKGEKVSERFLDTVRTLLAESIYIASVNNRDIPTPEDIHQAKKHIVKIYEELRRD